MRVFVLQMPSVQEMSPVAARTNMSHAGVMWGLAAARCGVSRQESQTAAL